MIRPYEPADDVKEFILTRFLDQLQDKMKLLVTSFGMTRHFPKAGAPRDVMSFPEYELLLLFDKLVLSEAALEGVKNSRDPSDSVVSEFVRMMRDEGFIESADFEAIVERNAPLLEKMLAHDLRILDEWAKPFSESVEMHHDSSSSRMRQHLENADTTEEDPSVQGKRRGLRKVSETFLYTDDCIVYPSWGIRLDSVKAARSIRKRRQSRYRAALRTDLEPRLRFVNSHLVLANELDAAFHNEMEFLPYYRRKFLNVGRGSVHGERAAENARKLFDVAFPEFRITDNRTFVKILRDSRLAELRTLINASLAGDVEFDQEFARNVYREVLHADTRAEKWRRIVSYTTLPVGFIPWIGTPAQKLLEESFGAVFEKKLKKEYRWFYLLSGASRAR